ncbi:MAG TPA: sugar transferase [Flavisolibacter sp.]|nr:sugar transferase [Flavisolibacter sp.]
MNSSISFDGVIASEIQPLKLAIRESYLRKRRVIEILIILLSSPFVFIFMLIISAAIFITDQGPVFFSQKRYGKCGKLFLIFKFRTMVFNCESNSLTLPDDERLTKLGKVLRKYKLDELPQLWNVLRGEMSLIGPRPVPQQFFEYYFYEIPQYSLRHCIRPGITGWAQVHLGYTNTLEGEKKKFLRDLEYIKNMGRTYDLIIVRETIARILQRKQSLE